MIMYTTNIPTSTEPQIMPAMLQLMAMLDALLAPSRSPTFHVESTYYIEKE